METPALSDLLYAASTIFGALGRGLLCLSRELRIVHASPELDRILGPGGAEAVLGRPVEEVLDPELFGPQGTLRRALEAGELREGWGATLRAGPLSPRRVSLSAAPIPHAADGRCDPRVSYVVVLRAAEEAEAMGGGDPTVFAGIVARSGPMLRIFRLIENLEESEATVLLTGESGTGKELVARAIHQHSPRRQGPFVAVNCGALPGELLESEMFGHVRGAFTGAVRDRVGRFEAAAGGTLFLDEVGDLPLPLQVKLLRVLQERTFERVGESVTRRSDVRVIAATNLDLRRAVQEGRFRDDLYYRLRVVPIEIPPLRERRADVEILARHLLRKVAARHGRSLLFAPDALRAMLRYPWPGNVRELENALEYAVAVCRGQTVHAEDLPVEILEGKPAGNEPQAPDERERLRAALEAHHWRRDEAAAALGMSRTTLWRKMRELELAS
ncbi:MAG TPA: sigma 54-interacting transcriptional regulator [Thermoanaerobaculia bacterium]|nr:sigma 54-interacting transcriptional regulator [Thermoanaerobaculia bacterium]